MPRWIRIEAGHLFSNGGCVRAEILLIDETVVADNECLDAGATVFCGPRYHRESPDHYAVDDIVERSSGSIGTLGFQDSEIVSVVRFGSDSFATCCGGERFRHQTVGNAVPIQTILPGVLMNS